MADLNEHGVAHHVAFAAVTVPLALALLVVWLWACGWLVWLVVDLLDWSFVTTPPGSGWVRVDR